MFTRIRNMAIATIALVTFVAAGARIVHAFNEWECTCSRLICEECSYADDVSWELYHDEAMAEYANEFTALFNSYETKRAKNGAMMIRVGGSGPYKFARKG